MRWRHGVNACTSVTTSPMSTACYDASFTRTSFRLIRVCTTYLSAAIWVLPTKRRSAASVIMRHMLKKRPSTEQAHKCANFGDGCAGSSCLGSYVSFLGYDSVIAALPRAADVHFGMSLYANLPSRPLFSSPQIELPRPWLDYKDMVGSAVYLHSSTEPLISQSILSPSPPTPPTFTHPPSS
jgi:hypothetical protein